MKKNKILVITITIIALILLVGGFSLLFNQNTKMKDSIKFKKEYESLNNTIRESDGALYNNVFIDEENPMKYVSIGKTIDLLDSKRAVIYIGANWCPWCRNVIPVMFDVAKDLDIDTIYYLNIDNEKSSYEIQDGELKKINSGSDDYYRLLDKLKRYLKDYILTDSEGNSYNTGEKRIYLPYFLVIKNGSIVGIQGVSRTLEDGQTKYSDMTEGQYKEVYEKFYTLFNKLNIEKNSCSTLEECS